MRGLERMSYIASLALSELKAVTLELEIKLGYTPELLEMSWQLSGTLGVTFPFRLEYTCRLC